MTITYATFLKKIEELNLNWYLTEFGKIRLRSKDNHCPWSALVVFKYDNKSLLVDNYKESDIWNAADNITEGFGFTPKNVLDSIRKDLLKACKLENCS